MARKCEAAVKAKCLSPRPSFRNFRRFHAISALSLFNGY